MAEDLNLPEGFVLENDLSSSNGALPEGFILEGNITAPEAMRANTTSERARGQRIDAPEKNRFKDAKSYLPFLSDQELQSNLQQNYEKNYSYQGSGRLFAEGAALGIGKQAESLGKVIGAKALGSKEKFGDLYKIAIEETKQELEDIRKRTGATGAISEFGGSLLGIAGVLKGSGITSTGATSTPAKIMQTVSNTLSNRGKAFTGAKTYLGNIGQSAAGGAAISAIQGAGDAENLSQIPENVAEKGFEGGAIGAALGAAFPVATKVGSSIYQGARNILGKKPANQIIEESISPEVAQKALTRLKESSAAQPTTALDVAEPQVENLVKAVAQYPESKQIAYDFALGRSSEANKRIKQVLKDNLTSSSRSASEVFDNAKAMQRELLPSMYEPGKNIELPRLYQEGYVGKAIAKESKGSPLSSKRMEEIENRTIEELPLETFKVGGGVNKTDAIESSYDYATGNRSKPVPSYSQKNKGGESTIGFDPATGVTPKAFKVTSDISERATPFSPIQKDFNYTMGRSDLRPVFPERNTSVDYRSRAGLIPKDESGIFSKPLLPEKRILGSEYEKLISNPSFANYAESAPRNLGELHEVRKVIDKDISSMKQAIINDPSKASVKSDLRNLEKVRGQISNVLYKGSGSKEGTKGIYEKADNAFARTAQVTQAIEEGREFYKLSPHDINKRIQETPDNTLKEFYRLGAREHLEDILNKSTKPVGTSKEAEKFIPNKYVRKQLRALVNNDKEYTNLMNSIKDEYKYTNTVKKFGLTKEAIENDKPSAVNFIAKLATNKTGLILDSIRAGERTILNTYKGINKKNAAEIMRTLSNKEKSMKAFENIVKNAEKDQKPLVREVLADMVPAILASRMASGNGAVQNANAEDQDLSPSELRSYMEKIGKEVPSAKTSEKEKQEYINSYQKRYNKKQ